MGISLTRLLVWFFFRGLSKSSDSALCKQHEGAFGGISFVACRGHIVETCSLSICLSLCDYLWEHLI